MSIFTFKQFEIAQDKCAMKIGTDGVLLGAWVRLNEMTASVLDVGAGTGVISLQIAQEYVVETIDAIELEPNAYEQCVFNFENSPWGDRLFCYHASFQEFVSEIDDSYDHIITNPPFYNDGHTTGTEARDIARMSNSLPLTDVFQGARKLLSSTGCLSMILPYGSLKSAMKQAEECGFFLLRITKVKGVQGGKYKRVLLTFSIQEVVSVEEKELVIEIKRHQYTQEYIDIVAPFYLKM